MYNRIITIPHTNHPTSKFNFPSQILDNIENIHITHYITHYSTSAKSTTLSNTIKRYFSYLISCQIIIQTARDNETN